ncbi:MAG: Gfo/Idh/MocA family oxidoreductase, partial [Gammaproteobacteria bacterium]|nr:Gfo/Idh/MocA family oxidoreductase [Gammaproteobacteria bacterium]
MTDKTNKPSSPERRRFLKTAGLVPAGLYLQASASSASGQESGQQTASGAESMMGYVAPVLDTVRVGVIGAGRRGKTILRLLAGIDGVDVKAVCDSYTPAIDKARALVAEVGMPSPEFHGGGEHAYREMLQRDDIDAVFVLTPWSWHTPMAVEVMQAGKHAFVEVPAALTLEEGWQLVEASEQTRMNCMMMENVCYGREELMALNMVRQGVLGELLHGEAAY